MDQADLLKPTIDPKIKAIGIRRVSAHNDAATRTVMMVRDHVLITDEKATNTGPTPLEMVLSALLGCEGVIINRCAEAMKFEYRSVEMDAEGEVDQRGRAGCPEFAPISIGSRSGCASTATSPRNGSASSQKTSNTAARS